MFPGSGHVAYPGAMDEWVWTGHSSQKVAGRAAGDPVHGHPVAYKG